jgi:NADH:ubiquinone oxidoreductase subunit 3 (subunit A)
MENTLLCPPLAFAMYVILVGILSGMGRLLAPAKATAAKSSIYASGEASPGRIAAPGYRPFFVTALFFAVLHLGVLMVGSSALTPITGLYLIGLMLALLALMLG